MSSRCYGPSKALMMHSSIARSFILPRGAQQPRGAQPGLQHPSSSGTPGTPVCPGGGKSDLAARSLLEGEAFCYHGGWWVGWEKRVHSSFCPNCLFIGIKVPNCSFLPSHTCCHLDFYSISFQTTIAAAANLVC